MLIYYLTSIYQVSLLPLLDLSQLDCLNESAANRFKSIVSEKSRNKTSHYLLSDADEQLLLTIPVCEPISSIALGYSGGSIKDK